MTDDRIVAFDMNAGRALHMATARSKPSGAAAKVADVRDGRLVRLAQLTQVYAGLLGIETTAADLQDCLGAGLSEDCDLLEGLATALGSFGLKAGLVQITRPKPDLWPALAETTQGHCVLILSQDETGYQLYDRSSPDRRMDVQPDELWRGLTGRVVRATASFASVQARHSEEQATHWFWGEFTKYRRQIAEVAAGSLVANLLAVAVALFSLQVYDRVIPHKSEPTLWVLGLGALLAVLFEGFLKSARSSLMDNTGRRIELVVQSVLMSRLIGMKGNPQTRRPGQIFNAMREFGSVREFFTASTIGTVADLPFIAIFLFLIASIGGNVVWVVIAGGLLMVAPSVLMRNKMMRMTEASQGVATRQARLLHEAVFEHETIAITRGEDRLRRLWAELTALNAVRMSNQRRLTSSLTYWAQGVQQATYIATVTLGAFLVFAGDFTVGTIIAIGILTGRTLGPLSQLSATMARWSNVKSALSALDAIVAAPQAEETGRKYLRRDRLSGAYEVRQLEFRYDPQSAATVDIPAMAIPAGQHVAVLGANGSGKSTLLRVLAGLYDPTAGRILMDGVDMGQIHPRDQRRCIGYLGQDVRLLAGTLRDNLNTTQLERDDERLFAALDFAGLGPFVRNHPRGLDIEIREMGEGLSVGQRQSIGWARMWLQDPSVVLLDEPTAALDQTLEATLVSRLHDWLAGRTAIIATHRVPILQLTERTIILQNGKLAVDGPRDAVLAHLMKAPVGPAAMMQGAPA